MSTALYRRYRPQTFAEVIGQEHVTEPLTRALDTGRVGHAYLFSGPRGCGKTSSARILARCLNCEQGPTSTPCGQCPSCVALARGGPGSVDVIEIDAASHGGVDDARDLREKASYGPAQSRFKVYIIDEAHMVTPQGFNALLKIVEEPPEHVKFVFATTEPDKVIGTIRSRTRHYPFRLVPPSRVQDYLAELCVLEGVQVEPGVLSFIVRAAGGSVRDALSVLDQLISGSTDAGLTYAGAASLLGFTEGELLDATVDALAADDAGSVFRQIDKVIETGHDPRRFIEDLLERLRDLIVASALGEGAAAVLRGVPEDQLQRMHRQAAAFGPGELSHHADIVNAGLSELTGATAPRLQLELICARLLLPAASGERGLAARVDRLERRASVSGSPVADASGRPPEPSSAAAPPERRPAPRDRAAVPPERPAGRPPASGGRVPAPTPAAAAPAVKAPTAGGARVDTDALRRSWPDVLSRIYAIRRVTWTFLSQHAQVLDYDGHRLLLGIATKGLATTFRNGPHAEVVRQALIESLGLDTRVEGVPLADAPQVGAVATPNRPQAVPGATPESDVRERSAPPAAPPTMDGAPDVASVTAGAVASVNAGAVNAGAIASVTAGAAASVPETEDGPPPEDASPDPIDESDPAPGVRGAPGRGAGDGATTGRRSRSRPGSETGRPASSRAGRRVPRRAEDDPTAGQGAASGPGDDEAASREDENVEASTAVGEPVITDVLGGTVIAETED
ncbi:MAG TPA: DNA polymerase III subunit gamma and tau [Dermatophilaceae bacterium]|nr:DNA polymerase III subunit gamma and tau [Dermatophilaceae bacterium]